MMLDPITAASLPDALRFDELRTPDATTSCRCCGFGTIAGTVAGHPVCHNCAPMLAMDHIGCDDTGCLIWLPHITQDALTRLVRALLTPILRHKETITQRHGHPETAQARRAFRALLEAQTELVARIGTVQPSQLRQALKNVPSHAHESDKLCGIRFVHTGGWFKPETDYYKNIIHSLKDKY